MIRRKATYAVLLENKPFFASKSQKCLQDKGIRNNLD